MADYPKPDGYVGSGPDGNMVRTGTGGRLALNLESQTDNVTDKRRNEVDMNYLPGEEL